MVNAPHYSKMKVLKQAANSVLSLCSFFQYFLPSKFGYTHLVIVALFMPAVYYQYRYNAIDYVLSLPFHFFTYPLEVDMPLLVSKVMKGEDPKVEPINLDDFPFVLDNDKMCKSAEGADETVFLLFLIKSALENTEARNTIRRTWAQEYNVPGVIIKHMFIVGVRPGDMKIQQKIAQEHEQWEDIAQGYFEDSYFNNTLKMMMGFHWVTSKCKGANFVGFVDDDFFVSTFNLVSFLQSVPTKEAEKSIYGYVWEYAVPFRYKASKWYLSRKEYPYRFFPPYPAAGAFFLSQDVAQRMYIAMHYTQYLKFDDVFIGIVAWKLKTPVKNNDNIYYHPRDVPTVKKRHKTVIAAHGFKDPNEIQKMWDAHMDYRHYVLRSQ